MPWLGKSAERLRMEFIVAHESQQYSFTELCELSLGQKNPRAARG
jgi:hypothetical protein